MNTSQRVFTLIFSGFAAVALVAVWYEVLSGNSEPNFIAMFVPVVLVIAGVVFTIRAFRNSVRLSDKSIELKSIAGNRALPLDKIKGRRRYLDKGDEESPSVWHLVLESNDDRFPGLDIQETYRFDDIFYHWFNSLPDLDVSDKTKPKPSNFGLV